MLEMMKEWLEGPRARPLVGDSDPPYRSARSLSSSGSTDKGLTRTSLIWTGPSSRNLTMNLPNRPRRLALSERMISGLQLTCTTTWNTLHALIPKSVGGCYFATLVGC